MPSTTLGLALARLGSPWLVLVRLGLRYTYVTPALLPVTFVTCVTLRNTFVSYRYLLYLRGVTVTRMSMGAGVAAGFRVALGKVSDRFPGCRETVIEKAYRPAYLGTSPRDSIPEVSKIVIE